MSAAGPAVTKDHQAVAILILMVGLPGAGNHKAKELAGTHQALRLTPDHWMIPLFGDNMADGKRFVPEGRLISVALQALRLGTSVVLDYGLWARDERSALRWLAQATGAACQVVYLPVEKDVQQAGRAGRSGRQANGRRALTLGRRGPQRSEDTRRLAGRSPALELHWSEGCHSQAE